MAKKRHGKHQTIPKELKPHIEWLLGLPSVKKVVLGHVTNCRTNYPSGHMAFNRNEAVGLKLRGYFGSGTMDFFVFLNDPKDRENVKVLLEYRFPLLNNTQEIVSSSGSTKSCGSSKRQNFKD